MATFTEFQKLTDIIVGGTYNAEDFNDVPDSNARDLLKRVNEETAEDLESLVKILEDLDVTVHRPNNLMQYSWDKATVQTPWFGSHFPNHPLMPRDVLGVFGNTIVEHYTASGGRFFENLAYTDISRQFYNNGYRWLSMPMAKLTSKAPPYNENDQIMFHAANIIKCGKDLFHSQSGNKDLKKGKGTDVGLDWLKKELGDEFRWNEVAVGGHCDGKIALLKPGVLMTWNKKWIPEKLQNWDIIEVSSETELPDEFDKMRKQRFYKDFIDEYFSHWTGYVDETVFDVNVLSVSEEYVICTGTNKEAFARMEKQGITPIYWNFRHQYFWDGGVHCVTQDLARQGSQEDYFA